MRLASHVAQFEAALGAAAPEAGVGRRLEFLLQEMAREANTIGVEVRRRAARAPRRGSQDRARAHPRAGAECRVTSARCACSTSATANVVARRRAWCRVVVAAVRAPMKRLREQAEKRGKLIDATQGRRTRSILILDTRPRRALGGEPRDDRGAPRVRTRTRRSERAARHPLRGVGAVRHRQDHRLPRRSWTRDPGIEFSISHTTRARALRRGGRPRLPLRRPRASSSVWSRPAPSSSTPSTPGNLYGTSFAALDAPLARGRDLLLEVDVQGALQLRERRRDARFVFLLPPSLAELERACAGAAPTRRRWSSAGSRWCGASSRAVHAFDYAVVNEDVERTRSKRCARSSPPSARATPRRPRARATAVAGRALARSRTSCRSAPEAGRARLG